MGRIGRTLVAVLVALGAAAVAPPARAQAPPVAADGYGVSDPTFAGDGTLDLTLPAIREDDGRFYAVVGGSQLVRYRTDGTIDPTFASTTFPFLAATNPAGPSRVLDDGRVHVVEQVPDGVRSWRALPAGGLDTTYGDGGGRLIDVSEIGPGSPYLALGDDGALVIAVVPHGGGSIHLARVDPDGDRDLAFGGDGVVEVVCCPGEASPTGELSLLAIRGRSDGSVVLRVRPTAADRHHAIVVGSDGQLGPSARIDLPPRQVVGVAVDDADRLLLWGTKGDGTRFFERRTAALALDPSFAPPGDLAPEVATGPLLHEGRIVFTFGNAIVSLEDDGSPTPGFGVAGRAPAFASVLPVLASNVAANPDGGYVARLGGFVCYGQFGSLDCGQGFRLAQVRDDGSVVSSVTAADDRKPGGSGEVWIADGGEAALVCRCSQGGGHWIERRPLERGALAPGAPGAPTVAVDDTSALVSWTPAATGPSAPGTETAVEVSDAVTAEVLDVDDGAVTGPRALTDLPSGRLLQVRARTDNRIGEGAWSAPSAPFVAPFTTLDALGAQLLRDFRTGKDPVGDPATVVAPLVAKTTSPATLVADGPLRAGFAKVADPVARLYQATFLRPADNSGLRHWIARRRSGATVAGIAAEFARSSEFRSRYGQLGTRSFVDRVYRNVLGRPADAGGLAYWSGRIDRGGVSRGQFLASMSESGEHQRKTAEQVATTNLYAALLDRAPTAAELTAAPSDQKVLVAMLMATEQYRARVDVG